MWSLIWASNAHSRPYCPLEVLLASDSTNCGPVAQPTWTEGAKVLTSVEWRVIVGVLDEVERRMSTSYVVP